jgi:pimeloyl-[acyl-carrier protein] methyl ester esterase
MYTVEGIAYHGWGFDDACWITWQKNFASKGWELKLFNRGYFGEKCFPKFEQEGNSSVKLLLIHSYGLHLCNSEHFKNADLVILFNCFKNIHNKNKETEKLLYRMIQQFKKDPLSVLVKFYCNVFNAESKEMLPEYFTARFEMADHVQESLLLEDLIALQISDFKEELLKEQKKALLFISNDDSVVKGNIQRDFAQSIEVVRKNKLLHSSSRI